MEAPTKKTQFEHKDYSKMTTHKLLEHVALLKNRINTVTEETVKLTTLKKLGVLMMMIYLALEEVKIRHPEIIESAEYKMELDKVLEDLKIDINE